VLLKGPGVKKKQVRGGEREVVGGIKGNIVKVFGRPVGSPRKRV